MTVTRERDGPVSHVRIERAERMNSFDLATAGALGSALSEAMEAEGTAAVLLSSAGQRAFCTGADVTTFQDAIEQDRARKHLHELSTTMNEVILSIAQGPKPVVAAVDGVAAGGGLGLALACDVRVGSPRARFTPAFLRVGVSPDAGTTWFLPRMIGTARARDVILRNGVLEADEAHDIGLLSELSDPEEDHEARCLAVARKLAEGPGQAMAWTKDRLSRSEGDLAEHLAYEAEATADSAATDDFREGVEAFLEGREPSFP